MQTTDFFCYNPIIMSGSFILYSYSITNFNPLHSDYVHCSSLANYSRKGKEKELRNQIILQGGLFVTATPGKIPLSFLYKM